MTTVICDYCGKPAELVDSREVYGRSYGHNVYLCRSCNAYVGCHRGTNTPMGRLANPELRRWKIMAHNSFDPLWKHGRFRGFRNVAYDWLAAQIGLPIEKTHIGMFDVEQCKLTVQICDAENKKWRKRKYAQ